MSELNTTVLILCAGKAERFNGHFKQLSTLGKESILGRIQRQVQTRGLQPITVTHHMDLKRVSVQWFEPEEYECTVDTLSNTRSLWAERTVVLLGDVVYSRAVMDYILHFDRDLVFYGDKWEIYALAFRKESWFILNDAILEAKEHYPGKFGTLYNAVCGNELDKNRGLLYEMRDAPYWIYVLDWTRDVDSFSQYKTALLELVGGGMLDGG